MVTQLSSCLVSLGSSRRSHPRRVSAPCSVRRCIARKFATGSGSLCLFIRRTYLLDLLRFALHRRFRYFCNLARHRLVAWRDYRRQPGALRRARGRHGVVGLAHRLRCMARESGSPGPFHLGECHDRIQMWRCALPCQHATTEAFRISWRSWKLLGKHRLLLQPPQRDEYDVIVSRRNCARAADPWKNFSQTQTGRALRCNRRNNCCTQRFRWRRTA